LRPRSAYPAPKQGLAHAQRLSYPRCGLPILVYAADRLGPKGRIILGSLPFTGWFFCFHDRGKLLSPCPFLPDHLNKQHPTLADSNQAYAAAPPSGEHPLVAVLTAVEAGLADPTNHYLINTTSFESPAGSVLLGMLHLQAHTTFT